jgi:hypothetical protein
LLFIITVPEPAMTLFGESKQMHVSPNITAGLPPINTFETVGVINEPAETCGGFGSAGDISGQKWCNFAANGMVSIFNV